MGLTFRRASSSNRCPNGRRTVMREKVIEASGATVEHVAGDRAYYRAAEDKVVLPKHDHFPPGTATTKRRFTNAPTRPGTRIAWTGTRSKTGWSKGLDRGVRSRRITGRD